MGEGTRRTSAAYKGRLRIFSVFCLLGIIVAGLSYVWPVEAVNRTWDGGGATNNWSEAANWSSDTVPVVNDTVTFDGSLGAASLKDCNIDAAGPQGANINISGISIGGSYTGTINVNNNVSPTIKGTSSQATGVFNCGVSLVKFEQASFTLNGGSFNCTSGNLQLKDDITLTLNGGTFNAPAGPTGLMSFVGGGNQTLNIGSTATFNHNNGSLSFASIFANINLNGGSAGTQEFNNLTFATSSSINFGVGDTVRVLGTLALNGGRFSQGILEAQGNMTVGSGFIGGGSGSGLLRIVGPTTRTITLASGLSEPMPKIELDAPNVLLNTSGAGTVQLHSFNLKQGVIDTGTANVSLGLAGGFRDSSQSGGTFNCGGGAVLFDVANFTLDGGSFNCTNSNLEIRTFGSLTLNAGTFNAPGENFTMSFTNPSFNSNGAININAAATFNHNNGTISFGNTFGTIEINGGAAGTRDLNNLTIAINGNFFIGNGDTVRVLGNLALNGGRITQGTLESRSGLSVGSSFIGGSGGLLRIAGPAARTISIPGGLAETLPPMEVDAPNVQINMTGANELKINTLNLIQGVISNGTTPVSFGNAGSIRSSFQSGGTFNCGGGLVKFDASNYTLSGGSFNCGNSNIEVRSFGVLQLDGGTFNAPAGPGGTLAFTAPGFNTSGELNINSGATFNHNNGTISFGTNFGSITLNGAANATREVFNLIENTPARLTVTSGDTLRVLNNLSVNQGGVSGSYEVQGNVTVASGVDTEAGSITFSGTNNQTFINNGGTNPTGTWTIDKTSGSVTAASSLLLGTSQTLNIKNGALFLNENSNLTLGTLTLGDSSVSTKVGKLINTSSTTITIGAAVQLFNNSLVDLEGGGLTCPQADSILIRSSVNGNRRNWTGQGSFKLSDVDVRDMGGSSATLPAITVFNGTNSGNNNTNWTFDSGCPPDLSLAPQNANVTVGNSQQFQASGGIPPYTFSVVSNPSHGSISTTTGFYSATSVGTDTVRVTDGVGSTRDATVNVFGTPHHLAFLVQPSNSTAGQTISAAVQVVVQDQSNNTVVSATNSVSISIGTNPGCVVNCGTLSGTTSVNAVNGVATFSNLSLQRAAIGYTLLVSSNSLTSATSNTFNVNPGVATKVGFVTSPTNTVALAVMTPSVQVAVQDAFGNTVAVSTGFITISLQNNPGNDQIFGSRSAAPVNGIATFNGILSNAPANGYTFVGQRTGLTSATSSSFNITRPTLLVTNTSNSGVGSLKQAIDDANTIVGADAINFSVTGTAPFTIQPVVPLPEITGPVVLDATTQPGYSGSPLIELRGQSPAASSTGLRLSGGNSTVKGLVINNFGSGIRLQNGGGNTIQANYLGTNLAGQTALGNDFGLDVSGSSNNLVGGTSASTRNVISGNLMAGIRLYDSNLNVFKGNYLGLKADGTPGIPNPTAIQITGNSSNSTIGGTSPEDANLISYSSRGVQFKFVGTSAIGNLIRGNLIRLLSPNLTVIDLDPDSRTNNDPGDADSGGNNRQNYPMLTSAIADNGVTTVQGTLNSSPSSSFSVDLYSYLFSTVDNRWVPTYQGLVNVATNASGIASFQKTLPLLTINHFIAATATDPQGSTSELSDSAFVVPSVVSISGRITKDTGQALSNVRVDLTGGQTAFTMTDANGNYAFNNLPGGITCVVKPSAVANYNMFPVSRTYGNTVTNQTNQNYTATKARSTMVVVLSLMQNGMPVTNSTVTVTGPVTKSAGGNGIHVFSDLPPGQYTVHPDKEGIVFSPSTANVDVGLTDLAVTFTAQPLNPLPGRLIFGEPGGGGSRPRSMNADGTALVTLPDQSAPAPNVSAPFKTTAALSRDGKFLVGKDSVHTLGVSNADGSNHRRLNSASPSSNSDFDYSISPDGTKIAFVGSSNSLRVVNVDGSGSNTLSLPSFLGSKNSPSWLSNSKIVFSATESSGNTFQLFVVNTDSTGFAQLTSGTTGRLYPVASPDGQKIAFATQNSQLRTINANGSGDTLINADILRVNRFAWSPDSTKLCFSRHLSSSPITRDFVAVNASNGGGMRVILNREVFGPSWGPAYEFSTATGSNVTVNTGFTTITFGGVTSTGTTTVTQIPYNSTIPLPGNFQLLGGNIGYEISTTSSYTPPITVCLTVPNTTAPTQAEFNLIFLMHAENGTYVDRTTSRNFTTRTICGSVNSLSPFALAEQVDNTRPSIHGLVQDTDGNAIAEITVQLTGTETQTTQTDAFGNFSFVNLTEGGNYNVQPKQVGYLFTDYSQDFFNLTGDNTAVFIGALSSFQISGRVIDTNGNPVSGVTIDAGTATTSTDANGNYAITNLAGDGSYTVRPLQANSIFSPAETTVDPLTADTGEVDFILQATPSPTPPTIQFNVANISAGEGNQHVEVSITRSGDTSGSSSLTFSTSDLAGSQNCNVSNGSASSRCDYQSSFSTIHFAAGETSKTLLILIVDDAYLEGPETFTLNLSNPSGAILGSTPTATVSISDNEIATGANPIDTAGFYVRQHYLDFFTREPDSGGLAFWTNEITSCGSNQECVDVKRINVSAAFYLSIEFQETGYLVERLYKTAYGDGTGTSTLGGVHPISVPIIRLDEFLQDTQRIGLGVVVGQQGWEQVLESNKVAVTNEFVERTRFASALPLSMTAAQFVDQLNLNAGNPLSVAERDQLIAQLIAGTKTRAQVLRAVAEDPDLNNSEFNRAFVLMQYFGYLRRDPNDLPDTDYTGYDFWLTKLNQFGGNFVNAEMVKAFILSGEYRHRFGP